MRVLSQRGGARVGWLSMSWPLAGIEVSSDSLRLSALREYVFKPEDVVSVEKIGFIPLLNYSVRIHHTRPDYPERVIFIPPWSREDLMHAVKEAGFRTGEPAGLITRGFPLKILPLFVLIVLWNGCYWFDVQRAGNNPENMPAGPGVFAFLALVSFFVLTTALQHSSLVQRIFLDDGRQIGELQPMVRFAQWLSGAMSLFFGLSYFTP